MSSSTAKAAKPLGFRKRRLAAVLAFLLLSFALGAPMAASQDDATPPKPATDTDPATKAKKKHKKQLAHVPNHKEAHTPSDLPGIGTLGLCVNISTAFAYPKLDSLGADLLDRDMATKKKPVTVPEVGKCYIPDFVSDVAVVNKSIVEITVSDSLQDSSTNIAASLGIQGKKGMFKGSLDGSFGMNQARSDTKKFALTKDLYEFYDVQLKDPETTRKYMQQGRKNLIDTGDPLDVINTLGTHYVRAVKMGAQCIVASTIDTSSYDNKMTIDAALKAAYKGDTTQVSGDAKVKYDTASKSLNNSSDQNITVIGGDTLLARQIMGDPNATPPIKGKYEPWLKSVRKDPAPCAYPTGGLGPIWELADTKKRQDELKAAIDLYLSKQETVAFPSKFPLHVGDVIAIMASSNSQYISSGGPGDNDWANLAANQATIAEKQNQKFTVKGTNAATDTTPASFKLISTPDKGPLKDKDTFIACHDTGTVKWLYLANPQPGLFHDPSAQPGAGDLNADAALAVFEIEDPGDGNQYIFNRSTSTYWSASGDGTILRLASGKKNDSCKFQIKVLQPGK